MRQLIHERYVETEGTHKLVRMKEKSEGNPEVDGYWWYTCLIDGWLDDSELSKWQHWQRFSFETLIHLSHDSIDR